MIVGQLIEQGHQLGCSAPCSIEGPRALGERVCASAVPGVRQDGRGSVSDRLGGGVGLKRDPKAKLADSPRNRFLVAAEARDAYERYAVRECRQGRAVAGVASDQCRGRHDGVEREVVEDRRVRRGAYLAGRKCATRGGKHAHRQGRQRVEAGLKASSVVLERVGAVADEHTRAALVLGRES